VIVNSLSKELFMYKVILQLLECDLCGNTEYPERLIFRVDNKPERSIEEAFNAIDKENIFKDFLLFCDVLIDYD